MDFRELCEHYYSELTTAKSRIFDLEKATAAHHHEAQQVKAQLASQATNEEQLLAAKDRIAHLEESSINTVPTSCTQEPTDNAMLRQELAAAHQRNQELEVAAADYAAWLNNFEKTMGFEATESAWEMGRPRQQVENAKGIGNALRTQVRNHEKQIEKIKKDATKANKELAKCQEALSKKMAELWRAKNIYNTTTPSPMKDVSSGTDSPDKPATAGSCNDQDDEEDCKPIGMCTRRKPR